MGVHESTVRRYADRGLIGAKRLPSGVRRLYGADVDALAARMEGREPGRDREAAERASPVTLEDLREAPIWGSDEDLEQFLALTYAERDRDR